MDNKPLRRIIGRKREELENGENYTASFRICNKNVVRVVKSKGMRQAVGVEGMGEMLNAYRILILKLEEMILLRGPSSTWEYNIGKNFKL